MDTLIEITNKKQIEKKCKQLNFDYELDFLDEGIYALLGSFSNIRIDSNIENIPCGILDLQKEYKWYNAGSKNNIKKYLVEIGRPISLIASDIDNAYKSIPLRQNLATCINYHKACFIEGETGSGKSYFILKLLEYLKRFNEDFIYISNPEILDGDLCSIISTLLEKQKPITLIIDEYNYFDGSYRKKLLENISKWINNTHFRLILSIRSNSIPTNELALIKEILPKGCQYIFPGISKQSIMEYIEGIPSNYIISYQKFIFSNNAMVAISCITVFENDYKKLKQCFKGMNQIEMVVNILEQSIKIALDRHKKKLGLWNFFKEIMDRMFNRHTLKTEFLKNELDSKTLNILKDLEDSSIISCTEKESSVSLKLLLGMSLMMVYHMHYFAYAYSMPILFMELNSKSYYLLGLFFYIGWAAYNLYEKRLKPKFLFFIFGHILSSIALFVLFQTTSFTVALVAWFVTGLEGGTIYMLPSLLSRNVVGIDHGLRIAEGIGHICGILLWGSSLYFFNSLRLSFIAAALLSLTVCILSIFYSSRLEAQNGY